MSEAKEVKVETQKSPATPEASGLGVFNDFFAPMFPLSRFARNPFAIMRDFGEEMDRMFKGAATAGTWAPTVDIQRCNGDLVVTAELPGLKKEEVKVEMTDEALIIEGERKREHKEDHEGYHRYERSYGRFYRAIPLPEGAKTELAKAELNEGVLKISLPVAAAEKKVRQIAIGESTEKKAA
jgi:HSP20 family protein